MFAGLSAFTIEVKMSMVTGYNKSDPPYLYNERKIAVTDDIVGIQNVHPGLMQFRVKCKEGTVYSTSWGGATDSLGHFFYIWDGANGAIRAFKENTSIGATAFNTSNPDSQVVASSDNGCWFNQAVDLNRGFRGNLQFIRVYEGVALDETQRLALIDDGSANHNNDGTLYGCTDFWDFRTLTAPVPAGTISIPNIISGRSALAVNGIANVGTLT